MSKKNSLYGCGVRVVYLVKISIDALSQFNDDARKMLFSNLITMHAEWRYHILTQGIRIM